MLPEPVLRLNGSAPTAALFHPMIDGDAAVLNANPHPHPHPHPHPNQVLNAATLTGPSQRGSHTVYVLELGRGLLLPSSDKLLTLSLQEVRVC